MTRALFICTENKLRSATAENMFAQSNLVEAIGAGTNSDAETPVSGDLIEWSEIIFVMETVHRKKLQQKFSTLLRDKRVVVLNVPDRYSYMQPELVALLQARVASYIPDSAT